MLEKFKLLALTAVLTALAGCEPSEVDCAAPEGKHQIQECVHRESTDPRCPSSLPANPTKW